jgi:hypothetical protein
MMMYVEYGHQSVGCSIKRVFLGISFTGLVAFLWIFLGVLHHDVYVSLEFSTVEWKIHYIQVLKLSTELFKALVYKFLGVMLRRLIKNDLSKLSKVHKTQTIQQVAHSLAYVSLVDIQIHAQGSSERKSVTCILYLLFPCMMWKFTLISDIEPFQIPPYMIYNLVQKGNS